MSIITITAFSKIDIAVAQGITINDVAVSVTTATRSIDLELAPTPFIVSLDSSIVTVRPDARWIPGSSISITLSGEPYKHQYYTPTEYYYYDPEQLLYSEGILDTVSPDDLLNKGLATSEEIALLQAMGPKLTETWDSFTKIIYSRLTYNGSSENKLVTRLVGFRRMQQIALMLGLDALVESVLISPGPVREWFRESYIAGTLEDSSVLESLPSVSKSISKLRNIITANNLNTEVIAAIDFQVDPNSEYNTLASYIITLFCGIRYTHDNPKFSY